MKSHPLTRNQAQQVHNLGKYLAGNVGGTVVHDFFEWVSVQDAGYYEFVDRELVIIEPIKLRLNPPMRSTR